MQTTVSGIRYIKRKKSNKYLHESYSKMAKSKRKKISHTMITAKRSHRFIENIKEL